jgi:hypothetical protein
MVCSPEYLDRAVEVGYDQLRLMVDSSRSDWDPRYTLEQLRYLGREAVASRDLEIVLVFWPVPHRATIDVMVADLEVMLGESGATEISAEAEGLLTSATARQMGWEIVEAKRYLLGSLLRLCDGSDVTLEITTHPSHPEAQAPDPKHPSRGLLAQAAHRVLWQVYGTRHDWQRRPVSWRGRYGPYGRRVDADRLAELSRSYGRRPCFGTPAWDLRWPDHEPEETLQVAHEILLTHDPDLIVDWMSGNTIGRFRNDGDNPKIIAWKKALIARVKAGEIS